MMMMMTYVATYPILTCPLLYRLHRGAFGDTRPNPTKQNYMPFFGGLVQNSVLVMQPPSLAVSQLIDQSMRGDTVGG